MKISLNVVYLLFNDSKINKESMLLCVAMDSSVSVRVTFRCFYSVYSAMADARSHETSPTSAVNLARRL